MRVGLVVPHIFMQESILPHVIFAPGKLATDLAEGLREGGIDTTLFTPGRITTKVPNITADLGYFERELETRGDTYLNLLKKHPLTFITLARQVQCELIAKAYTNANADELDLVHIYTNEEDIALPFAPFCKKPVVFTHHDPFNFLIGYKNLFPKYKHYPWISVSLAQRKGMPADTNWLANIPHGIDGDTFKPNYAGDSDYVAYLGRIIEPKGVHIAIEAIKRYNGSSDKKLKLRIAGKHYAGSRKDTYWHEQIRPQLSDKIEYVGYIKDTRDKQSFLAGARALLVPSVFEEPFGMVMIEALACGTPVIGLNSGAIPEIVQEGETGFVVQKTKKTVLKSSAAKEQIDVNETAKKMADAIAKVSQLDRRRCRADFEARFTLERMCDAHQTAYKALLQND